MLEVYDASVSVQGARLVNLSARAQVGTGDKMLIPGLVIGGSDPVRVLVRVVGPGLAGFGVTGALARPSMTVFRPGAEADQFRVVGGCPKADIAAAAASVGAFPLVEGSADCAALLTLSSGAYTIKFPESATRPERRWWRSTSCRSPAIGIGSDVGGDALSAEVAPTRDDPATQGIGRESVGGAENVHAAAVFDKFVRPTEALDGHRTIGFVQCLENRAAKTTGDHVIFHGDEQGNAGRMTEEERAVEGLDETRVDDTDRNILFKGEALGEFERVWHHAAEGPDHDVRTFA